MSIWLLLQIAINIALFLGIWILWSKFRRPPKDDPRLSKGLQLLQSKISVLEDLSDKTDNQVSQLAALLEKKCREIQMKMRDADQCMDRIDQSVAKSLDVASIFEDRIPHQEIIDRQRTKSYIKAAQMAHQGCSIDEISEVVDLNRGELEMIVKVNRDRLMFSEDELPEWAKDEESEEGVDYQLKGLDFKESGPQPDLSQVFRPVIEPPKSLEKLGEDFRQACREVEEREKEIEVESQAEKVVQQLSNSAVNQLRKFSQNAKDKINEITHPKENRKARSESPNHKTSEAAELMAKVSQLTSPMDELEQNSADQEAIDEMTATSAVANENSTVEDAPETQAETTCSENSESVESITAESAPSEVESLVVDLDDGMSKQLLANSETNSETDSATDSAVNSEAESQRKVTSKKIVRDVEVKKVQFPKIDTTIDLR